MTMMMIMMMVTTTIMILPTSEELDKRVKFEIILISPQMLGKMQGAKAEVIITLLESQFICS
jgi:hypothetical protein